MLPDPVFKALLLLPIGVMAVGFLFVGVRGLVTRRPFVFAARIFAWLFIVLVASMSFSFVSLMLSPYSDGIEFMSVAQIVMFLILIVVFWRVMQGYVVLGVTDDTFKQALSASLDELGLAHKESLGGYALDELGDVLLVSVQGWVGSGQLKMKTRGNQQHLKQVVAALRHRLAQDPGRASLFIPVTYTAMGLLMIAIGLYMAFEF
jgi:hypothetical protein